MQQWSARLRWGGVLLAATVMMTATLFSRRYEPGNSSASEPTRCSRWSSPCTEAQVHSGLLRGELGWWTGAALLALVVASVVLARSLPEHPGVSRALVLAALVAAPVTGCGLLLGTQWGGLTGWTVGALVLACLLCLGALRGAALTRGRRALAVFVLAVGSLAARTWFRQVWMLGQHHPSCRLGLSCLAFAGTWLVPVLAALATNWLVDRMMTSSHGVSRKL